MMYHPHTEALAALLAGGLTSNTVQQQHQIPLHFLDGREGRAARTGNNAAWLCACGSDIPLVGYSDAADSDRVSSLIPCRECGRMYRVSAPGLKKVPTEVREVERPAT